MKNSKSIGISSCCASCEMWNNLNKQREQIIKNYLKSYNDYDIGGMIKDLDRDIVFENISNGNLDLRTQGLDKFREHTESEIQYTQQRERTVESWQFDESKVSIHIKFKGILSVDIMEKLEAGDVLELKGKSEFVFDNEKIQRITDEA